MSADTIQSNYEQLTQVAQRFAQRAQTVQQMQTALNRQSQAIAATWDGKGSQAFFREMQQVVMPGVQRLHQALTQAGSATTKIAQVLHQAEDDAAKLFKGSESGGVPLEANLVAAASLLGPGATGILNALQGPAGILGGIFKGLFADGRLNTRYILRALTPDLTRGQSSVAMLMDMLAGKGNPPRGLPIIRFDGPHRGSMFPHINIEKWATGRPDPHVRVPQSVINWAGRGARLLEGARRIALPVAIGLDVFRIGSAFQADGGTVGSETRQAIGGVAGGWAGAFAGAKGGALLGGAIGSIFPGPGTAIGAFAGGVIGGIAGGIGGGWLGEKLGGLF